MQETFIVTVTTEDGKLLTQHKINGNLRTLSWQLFQLSLLYRSQYEDLARYEMWPGSGTGPSASDSSSPTPSSQ